MVTHHEYFSFTVVDGLFVESECPTIEPAGPGLFVVMKAEPDVFELTDLCVVLTPPQIDDVGDTEGLELLSVGPGRYRASER